MTNIKEALFSDKGMSVVNNLFFLSTFIHNRGVIFIAYPAWIVYLEAVPIAAVCRLARKFFVWQGRKAQES